MTANATERESDFSTVLEIASQARAEFKRQRNWGMAKTKVGRPLTVLPHMLQWPVGSEEKEVILVFSHTF